MAICHINLIEMESFIIELTKINLLTSNQSIEISSSFLFNLGKFYISKTFSISVRLTSLLAYCCS